MKQVWSSREALLRYMRLEGWLTGMAVCQGCCNVWDVAYAPGTPAGRLECPRCHQQHSSVLKEGEE
jgi:hypothetical protein